MKTHPLFYRPGNSLKGFALSLLFLCCFSEAKAQTQIITTIAGTGTMGYSGDGGAPTAAMLNTPYSVITDAAGNVYIADALNHCIRKISTSGIITTIAGTGVAGMAGDGGPATAAELFGPISLAFDPGGNIIIADQDNQRVRKLSTTGILTTIAGNGTTGISGEGGPASIAQLNYPTAVAVDPVGNIYIADQYNNRIRKIDVSGIITTIAGTGTSGLSGDGGPASVAQLALPCGVAADASGNVYFTDYNNFRVRKISTSGLISTIAGTTSGFGGDGGPATAALFTNPFGIALDALNNIYVTDIYNYRIRKINTSGIISTIAGSGTVGYGGDGGAATTAMINLPSALYVDCGGSVYFADQGNHRVRMISGNNTPYFNSGSTTSISVCKNSSLNSLNSKLAVVDADLMQTEQLTLLSGPSHGSAIVSYSTTSTGVLFTPTGLSYTPATGYIGNDTLRVVVTDCGHTSDTITIYVAVINCPLGQSSRIIKSEDELYIYPNPANDELTIRSDIGMINTYAITNSVGQQLMQQQTNTAKATVNIKMLPAGLYYIILKMDEGTIIRKFVKM